MSFDRQKVGLALVLLGCLFFVVAGFRNEARGSRSVDFKGVYGGARCMLKGCNPYNEEGIRAAYVDAGGDARRWYQYPHYNANYLPPALFLVLPIAAMPWPVAHLVWLSIVVVSFVVATLLMWDVSRGRCPVILGGLLGLFAASSTVLVMSGNPAGIALSLCVIAAWCLLRGRLQPLGLIAFAISLIIKPHVSGLVWLYFFLSGPQHRRSAIRILAITILASIPGTIWMSVAPASRHWVSDLKTNLTEIALPGRPSDPGPSDLGAINITDLQTVVSVFDNSPKIYNLASYGISLVLLAAWGVLVLRSDNNDQGLAWTALAVASCLTFIPSYHRVQDSRLIFLIFPALNVLWQRSSRAVAWTGVAATMVTVLMTAHPLLQRISQSVVPDTSTLGAKLKTCLLLRPVPLVLLFVACFYLLAYARQVRQPASPGDAP